MFIPIFTVSFIIPCIVAFLMLICGNTNKGMLVDEDTVIGKKAAETPTQNENTQDEPTSIDYGRKIYVTSDATSAIRYQTKLDYVVYKTNLVVMETRYSTLQEITSLSYDGTDSTVTALNSNCNLHVVPYTKGKELTLVLGARSVSVTIDADPTTYDTFLFVTPVIDTWCTPCAVLLGATTGTARMPQTYDKIPLIETGDGFCYSTFEQNIGAINESLKFYLEGTNYAFHSLSAYKVSNMKIESLITNRASQFKALSRTDLVPSTMGNKIYFNAYTRCASSKQLRMAAINMTNIAPTWTRYELVLDGGEILANARVSAKSRAVYDTEYLALQVVVFTLSKTGYLIIRNTELNEEIHLDTLDLLVDDTLVTTMDNPQYITVKDVDYILSDSVVGTSLLESDDFSIGFTSDPTFVNGKSYRLYSAQTGTRPLDLTQATLFANATSRTERNNFVQDFVTYPAEETVSYDNTNTVYLPVSETTRTVSRKFVQQFWSSYPTPSYHPEDKLLSFNSTFSDTAAKMSSYGGKWQYLYEFENFSLPMMVEQGTPQEFLEWTVTNESNLITVTTPTPLDGFVYNLVDMATLKPVFAAGIASGSSGVAKGYNGTLTYKVIGIKDGVYYTLSESASTLTISNNSTINIVYDRQFNTTTATVTITSALPLTMVKFGDNISFTVTGNSDGTYTGTFTLDPTTETRTDTLAATTSDGASLGDVDVDYAPPVPFNVVSNHVQSTFKFYALNPSSRYQPTGPYTVDFVDKTFSLDDIWTTASLTVSIDASSTATMVVKSGEFVVVSQEVQLYKNTTAVTQTASPKNSSTNILYFTLTTLSPYSSFYVDNVLFTKFEEGVFFGDKPVGTTTVSISLVDQYSFTFIIFPTFAVTTISPALVQTSVDYAVYYRKVNVDLYGTKLKEGESWFVTGNVTKQTYTSLKAAITMQNDTETTATAYSGTTQITPAFTNTGPYNKITEFDLTADGTVTLHLDYPQTIDQDFYVTVNGVKKMTSFSAGVGSVVGIHDMDLTVKIETFEHTIKYSDPNIEKLDFTCHCIATSADTYYAFLTSDTTFTTFRSGPDYTAVDPLDTLITNGTVKFGLDYFSTDYIVTCPAEVTKLYAFDANQKLIGCSSATFAPFLSKGSASMTQPGIVLNSGNADIPVGNVSISEMFTITENTTLYGTDFVPTALTPSVTVTQSADLTTVYTDLVFVDYPYIHGMQMNGVTVTSLLGGFSPGYAVLANKSCKNDPNYKASYETYWDLAKSNYDEEFVTGLVKVSGTTTIQATHAFSLRLTSTKASTEITVSVTDMDKLAKVPLTDYINPNATEIVEMVYMTSFPSTTYTTTSLNTLDFAGSDIGDTVRFVVGFTDPITLTGIPGLTKLTECTIPPMVTTKTFDATRWFALSSTDTTVTYGNQTFYRLSNQPATITPSYTPEIVSVGYNDTRLVSVLMNSDLKALTPTSTTFAYNVSSAPDLHSFFVYSPNSNFRSDLTTTFSYAPTALFVPDYKNTYENGGYTIETKNQLYDFISAADTIKINGQTYTYDGVTNGAIRFLGDEIVETYATSVPFTINGVAFTDMVVPDQNFHSTFTSTTVNVGNFVYGDWDGNIVKTGTYTFTVKFSQIPATVTDTSTSYYDYDIDGTTAWRKEVYAKYFT